MRNLKAKADLEKAAGNTLNKTLFIRELDVNKESTIKAVVDEIIRDNGRMDVLVNNAGFAGMDAIDQVSLESCEDMMNTNFWGPVRTMRAVLPAMKKQNSGRIVNVSSTAGIEGLPFSSTYSATKFALEGFSEASAPVLRDVYNIRLIIVQPGPVMTAMGAKIMSKPPEEQAKDFDAKLKESYLGFMKKMMSGIEANIQSGDDVAKVILDVILTEKPHLRYQTSKSMTKQVAKRFHDTTGDACLEMLKDFKLG